MDERIRFVLRRVAVRENGAYGVLLDCNHTDPITGDDLPFAVTMERTYAPVPMARRLEHYVKIQPGVYTCRRGRYNRGGYPTYDIEVPGREHIKFHMGNWETDLDGCPAIGESYEIIDNREAIAGSRGGFNEFMQRAGNVPGFKLRVIDVAR